MTDDETDDQAQTDGGLGALDPPPLESLDERTLSPDVLARNAAGLETVITLLTNPALARVYVYACYWGPVTPAEIQDGLSLSKSTTYAYLDRLDTLGLVDRDDSSRPQQVRAEPVILVEEAIPVVITPTVVHAFALGEIDEDVAYFVDRYGVGKLIAALRGAGLHSAGKRTQRMVGSEIDVRDTEAMLIINALEPALIVGREHDPYFDYLFPDVHDEMDLPGLDAVETTPARPPTPDE